MSASVTTICICDEVTKHVIIISERNTGVSEEVLRALFQSDIVGLQCIDKNSNIELFNIVPSHGQYIVIPEKDHIYKIMKPYKETTSLTNTQQKSNELSGQIDSLHLQCEKSLTPTNEINRSEFNKLLSSVDTKLAELSLNIDTKLAELSLNIDTKLAALTLNIDTKLAALTLNIDKKLNSMSNDLKMLYELIQPTIRRTIDPWDITARSQGSSDSSLPKQIIINYYGLRENECMICGRCSNVVNVHIWPKHTHGEYLLSMFGLVAENLNDPRNYLRLSKALELAFDNKTVTVIYQHGQLVLFVLDEAIKQQVVSNTRYTFNDCHLWPLNFGNSHRPYLRILAAHCRNSFMDAFRLKRIDYKTYKLGYNSSLAMLNESPDGAKAKVFDWFERNEKIVKRKLI